MTKGYIIAELEITKPEGYTAYTRQVLATITAYGGRFLVRGGETQLVEGTAPPKRIVVVEFDSPEKAMAWYHSPEYQAILPLRLNSSTGRLVLVTGAPPVS